MEGLYTCGQTTELDVKMGYVRNDRGIALVMVLVLSVIALAIMAGLIYMITVGTQLSGIQKRYNTALEAGVGGRDVAYQIIALRMDNPANLEQEFNFINLDVTTSQTCLNNKLLLPTSKWDPSCNKALSIDPNDPNTYDMSFDLGVFPTYRVYTKIVDTVEGNSGGDEGLVKTGVVLSNTGEVPVMSMPYLYTIEIDSENLSQPVDNRERAKLSILYQY